MRRVVVAVILVSLLASSAALAYVSGAVGFGADGSLGSVDAPKKSALQALGETHVSVPFYYQEKDYYCGPASLEMVFDYYGENVSQSEIACVARSIGDPLYVTYTDELRRAGHFSNVSTSMGGELAENITGYTLRQLGYAAFESFSDLATLRSFLDQGKPLILLMWYSGYHVSGHFRVATGYNDTHVFLHDPWNKPLWGGTYGGPDIAFNNSAFLDLWSYYGNWTLYVSPWTVSFSAPAFIVPGTPFQVESTVTYPQPLPNSLAVYPASACNASITLPANLSLAPGESREKTVGTGLLQAGDSSSLNWTVVADSSVEGTVTVEVEGTVSGSVWAHASYPAYDYSDRIGASVNFSVSMAPAVNNIVVSSVRSSKTVVGRGCSLNVTVAVTNQGSPTENFTMTVYANATAIQTGNVSVRFGFSATLTLVSNTSGLAYGNYTISAYVWPVPDETNVTDNSLADGTVYLGIPGDLKSDGVVNILDAIVLGIHFRETPDSPGWNRGGANADINGDGVVNILDAIVLGDHFGEHYP